MFNDYMMNWRGKTFRDLEYTSILSEKTAYSDRDQKVTGQTENRGGRPGRLAGHGFLFNIFFSAVSSHHTSRTKRGKYQVEFVPFNPVGPASVLLRPLLDTGESVIVPGDQALHEGGRKRQDPQLLLSGRPLSLQS